MSDSASDDKIRGAIAANLAATHYGDLLRAQRQSIVACEARSTKPHGAPAEPR